MNKILKQLSVGKKLMLVGGLFALTLIGIVVYTVMTLGAQEGDSLTINIAGRERMLTQKFTKEVLQEQIAGQRDHLPSAKTAKLFELSLHAIRKGGNTFTDLGMTHALTLPANSNPEIEAQLSKVAANWQKLTTAADAIRTTSPSSASFIDETKKFSALSVATLKTMHHSVGMIAAESHAKIKMMERIEWLILLLALVSSGLLLLVVARAIIRPLHEAAEIAGKIAHGDLNHRIQVDSDDEVGILMASLQAMQKQLSSFLKHELPLVLHASQKGDFSKSISSQGKEGVFADITKITNDVMATLNQGFEDVESSFSALQKGNLNQYITHDYEGGFDRCKQAANKSMQQLDHILHQEVQPTWEAAQRGDLSGRIDVSDKQGFYKNLAVSSNALSDLLELGFGELEAEFVALQKGDLTHRITGEFEGIFDRCKNAANQAAEQMAQVMGDVRTVAEEVGMGSSEIAEGNNTLSNRTQEQAAALEETAASIEEITGTVQQTADNSRQANQLSADAKDQAENGGKVADQAVQAMAEINVSSRKISDIIGVIDEIAFQTNLLALNAAVEAARAGEQGRGFAVVAGEVRTLAQRSAEAAKEIKTLINSSVESVTAGSKLVDQSGDALHDIVAAVGKVNDIIAEIAAASVEQTAGIDQINKAVAQLDSGTQQNTAMVEESAAASQRLNDQALELRRQVSIFDLGETGPSQAKSPRSSRQSTSSKQSVSNKQSVSTKKTTAPRPASKPAKVRPQSTDKATMPTFPKAGTVEDDDVWEEF